MKTAFAYSYKILVCFKSSSASPPNTAVMLATFHTHTTMTLEDAQARPLRVNRLRAMYTNLGPEHTVPSVLAKVLELGALNQQTGQMTALSYASSVYVNKKTGLSSRATRK